MVIIQFKFITASKAVCIVILTILCQVTPAVQVSDVPKSYHAQKTLHRFIRSPQLFPPGRNVLSDLTQLKPPTLDDLKDFKEKMATLANLTAFLEHAIAAEKTARTTLQNFVNTIKEQITGIQKAVNPDPENYWTEIKTCGGLLVSQTGRISYKPDDYYNNYDRCLWSVRTNHRSKIRVTLTRDGLETIHDYVSVTELISSTTMSSVQWNTKRLTQGQTSLFEGPLIFVTFVSDGSIRKTGFQLEFEGMGSNINSKITYQHFHFSDWMGQFDSDNLRESLKKNEVIVEENSPLLATVVISPTNWNLSKLEVSVDPLKSNCEKTNLALLNDFSVVSRGDAIGCCGGNGNCEMRNLDTINGIILGIVESTDLGAESFQINWSTDSNVNQVESVDECGGILSGNFGRISYKENIPYANNERCFWLIRADIMKEGEIKLQLLKDGFEQQYDYISATFLTNDGNDTLETKFLYKSGTPLQIQSPFILVEFYSDAATFGKSTGFELIWEIKQTSNKLANIDFDISNEENGSKLLSCSEAQKQRNTRQMFVTDTHKKSTHSVLTLFSDDSFSPEEVSTFVSERGNFSRVENGSNDSLCQSKDGIVVLLRKCVDTSSEILLKWETREVLETGESTDDELFVKSDDECGDVLFGDSGRITYKMGKEYDLNERCTWIIRSKRLSTITVQLMADGFESCCDTVQINKINILEGTIDPEGIFVNRENRFQSMDTPALLVTFLSDHSVKGTGFALEFQTKGDPIAGNVDSTELKHQHVKLDSRPTSSFPFGPIFIQISDNLLSIDTFVLQHVEIEVSNISVELHLENLQINECNIDSVALYHMPVIGKYDILKTIPSGEHCSIERLAGINPITSVLKSEQEKFQLQPKSVLVVVTKIVIAETDKTLSLMFK